MTDAELAEAWTALHAAAPPGWFVGRPGQRHGGQWAMYAFDTTEKAEIGRRSRAWTAVGQTEVDCVREYGALSAGDQRGPNAEVAFRNLDSGASAARHHASLVVNGR